MGKLRKSLSAPGLLGTVRKVFRSVPDTRVGHSTLPLDVFWVDSQVVEIQ